MNAKKLRIKAIKLFGHLSPGTKEILETKCFTYIAQHLGKYRKEVLPILLKHKDVPAEFWYNWGLHVGDREIALKKLLEIRDTKWLCCWGRFVGNKEVILAKLLEIGDPGGLYNWGINVGDSETVLVKLIEIGDPGWPRYWDECAG